VLTAGPSGQLHTHRCPAPSQAPNHRRLLDDRRQGARGRAAGGNFGRFAVPAAPAPHAIAFGGALSHPLERRCEAQKSQDRPEYPGREVERADRQRDGAPPGELEDRAGFPAFGRSKARNLRHVARPLGQPQSVERRLRAGPRLHASDVADEAHQALSLLDLDRLARGTHGGGRLDDARALDGTLERRPVHHLAQRAVDPGRHLAAHPPGLARGLDHRDADPGRGGGADGRICSGRDRQPDASQAENQLVGLLPGRKPRAFAQRVADIPEHEQVSDRGARQSREIVRLAGDEPAGKAPDRPPRGRGGSVRGVDRLHQGRIDRHAAVAGEFEKAGRQIDIVRRERSVDLARGHRAIKRARNRMIGERYRIVLRREQMLSVERARRNGQRGNRQGHRQAKRQCDPRSGHELLLRPFPCVNVVGPAFHGKRSKWKIRSTDREDWSQPSRTGGKSPFPQPISPIYLGTNDPPRYGAVGSQAGPDAAPLTRSHPET
jgi:hypothetical protein